MLAREEYIEQSYLFRRWRKDARWYPTQEALKNLGHEILATTKLPLAIDYQLSDLKLPEQLHLQCGNSIITSGIQTFVMTEAEDEEGRFDLRTALCT